MENLCSCPEARHRGTICAHSVAAGLFVIRGVGNAVAKPGPAEPQPLEAQRPVAHHAAVEFPTADVPGVRVHLEGSTRSLSARLEFVYQENSEKNPGAEALVLKQFLSCDFADRGGVAVLQGEPAIRKFYASVLPKWQRVWEVQIGERFQHVTSGWMRLTPHVSLQGEGSDWLDFRLFYTAGADAVLSAEDLRKLLAGGQNSLTLKNGKTAIVDSAELEDWEEVLRDCDPRREGNSWKIDKQYADYILESAKRCGAAGLNSTKGFQSSAPWIPGPLFELLRPYQQAGSRWMGNLALRKLGGLLADEMGLGKTLQALSILETLPGRRLVVCPSSLVWNWQEEAHRFCPSMNVVRLEGSDREQKWKNANPDSVFVTSYALLRRDLERYKGIQFSALVLDEAQHIKNPESRNAQSAREINAQCRFVLTGTPLENSLSDLWSLFEFALPGYLGGRRDFQERYELPLREARDVAVWTRLHRRIGPFYLRRRKVEILPELPEKIEQVIEVPMGQRQRILYDQLQAAAREKINLLEKDNRGAARMQALTALLRLRQCCCDPRLLGAPPLNNPDEEGKLGALLEILAEVIDGGHRALVFSQFTSMLDLIEVAIRNAGHGLLRLDGSTRDRGQVVQEFQSNPSIGVFLISLKAGGVGLNLTGADTVIHFDPWWNPAVEAQATDRAHRIGQKHVVTSIKLIAADTVESRVLRMQEEKRAMLAATLDSDSPTPKVSMEDLSQILGAE
jgi:SNF2 family DNA or RNA helicase